MSTSNDGFAPEMVQMLLELSVEDGIVVLYTLEPQKFSPMLESMRQLRKELVLSDESDESEQERTEKRLSHLLDAAFLKAKAATYPKVKADDKG